MSLDVRGGFDVLVSDGYELEGEVNQIMLSNCMSRMEYGIRYPDRTHACDESCNYDVKMVKLGICIILRV